MSALKTYTDVLLNDATAASITEEGGNIESVCVALANQKQELLARVTEWQPIKSLDKRETQFVMVAEDGCVRLRLWNSNQQAWEVDRGGLIDPNVDSCAEPTHWAPCPKAME